MLDDIVDDSIAEPGPLEPKQGQPLLEVGVPAGGIAGEQFVIAPKTLERRGRDGLESPQLVHLEPEAALVEMGGGLACEETEGLFGDAARDDLGRILGQDRVGIAKQEHVSGRYGRAAVASLPVRKDPLALDPHHADGWKVLLDIVSGFFRAGIIDHDHFGIRLLDHSGKALLQMLEPALAHGDDAETALQCSVLVGARSAAGA